MKDVIPEFDHVDSPDVLDKGLKGNYLVGHSLMRRAIVEIV